ncbi:hypothetical protein GCM10011316_34770 [Roseibium aquae]|uniref:TMEM205-like domain-containing protein n=1 Tax=Roseibium aquae TaxID=1323746 RepID=A0A916X380_9HYPH|nr:DUF4149 domain-containing protein [Roseibium aquae]GGB59765.1 hypothetical protein GCM10011316_34770 [Roseibium aquae]
MLSYISLLIVSILFGGMTLYSFGFAPLVFKNLDPATAAAFLRTAFKWYYVFVGGAAAIGAAALGALDTVGALILLAVALVALYARQGLMPQINSARDAQLAGDASAKTRFDRLHAVSVALNMLQLVAVGFVLYGFV